MHNDKPYHSSRPLHDSWLRLFVCPWNERYRLQTVLGAISGQLDTEEPGSPILGWAPPHQSKLRGTRMRRRESVTRQCRRRSKAKLTQYLRRLFHFSVSTANRRYLSRATSFTRASRTASTATSPSTPTSVPNAAFSSPPKARLFRSILIILPPVFTTS